MGIFIEHQPAAGGGNETTVFHRGRLAVAILLAALLIAAAVFVSTMADAFAVEQAKLVLANEKYKPPTSTLPAAATAIFTLATAWSAALVAILIGEKSA